MASLDRIEDFGGEQFPFRDSELQALPSSAISSVVFGVNIQSVIMRLLFSALVIGLALVGHAQDSPNAALVEKFKNATSFWAQFDIGTRLVALRDSSILEELEPYLSSDDRHVRGNVAFVFGGLGDKRGFDVICAILSDRSPRQRGQGYPDGWSVQEQIRADRYYAAHLLGDLRDQRAVPILIPLLQAPDVQYIVPWALGQIGEKSAIPPLIATLDDTNPDMRVLALYALEKLHARQALPRIRALVNDNERIRFDGLGRVSEAAKEAIALLEESAWHATQGTPVATRVITDTGDSSPSRTYYGECQVKYFANGREYLLWAAAYAFWDESVVRQEMSSCPISSFTVRYSASDPTEAVALRPNR